MNQETPLSPSSLVTIPHNSGDPQSPTSTEKNLPSLRLSEGALALNEWEDAESAYVTNLPAATETDIVRLSSLLGVSDAKSKALAGQTVALIGVAVDWGKHGENEDGEIIEGLRAHMLTDDGKVIFSTSGGILRSLRMALKVYGKGVWNPAVLLEIRSVPSKRGDALVGILRGRKEATAKKK